MVCPGMYLGAGPLGAIAREALTGAGPACLLPCVVQEVRVCAPKVGRPEIGIHS